MAIPAANVPSEGFSMQSVSTPCLLHGVCVCVKDALSTSFRATLLTKAFDNVDHQSLLLLLQI